MNWAAQPHLIERLPQDIKAGQASFGISLYEIMWCQRRRFRLLPIPYCLHYIVTALTERGVPKTATIFRRAVQVEDARAEINRELYAVQRFDAHVLSALLLVWLRDLPNPIIPVEMHNEFLVMATDGKFIGFVEKMPQVHRLTLLYLTGFLKTLLANKAIHGLSKRDIAKIFGPPVVNSVRGGRPSSKLDELAVSLLAKLMTEMDTTIVFPLNDEYLVDTDKSSQSRGKHSGSTPLRRASAERPEPESDDDLYLWDDGEHGRQRRHRPST
jgi:hypothetical protein